MNLGALPLAAKRMSGFAASTLSGRSLRQVAPSATTMSSPNQSHGFRCLNSGIEQPDTDDLRTLGGRSRNCGWINRNAASSSLTIRRRSRSAQQRAADRAGAHGARGCDAVNVLTSNTFGPNTLVSTKAFTGEIAYPSGGGRRPWRKLGLPPRP